jgi:hypothetical protein
VDDVASAGNARHRFRLGPLLGAGTFGEVYLARLTSLHGIEQDVAVKLLNPGLSPKSQPVSRMRDEGRMLAALNHPAILHVMDFCYLDQRIGLVTELVPGADLHACIFGDDPIPPRAALQVIGTCADALHAAYFTRTDGGQQMSLVHRDVKPANIRITPHGTVKLLDFGIARSDDERRETETTERSAIGTPSYMAPEVQAYEVLDALPSRDVFALGATLYEALVGELYFEGLAPLDIGRLCVREARFSEWRSSRMPKLARFGPRTADLVARMLRFDHTQRPTSREVADLCLEAAEQGEGETLRAWCRRRPWPTLADRTGPWSGRELQDAGVVTRIDADVASSGPTAHGSTTMAPGIANPTIVAVDEARASQLVEQAVQAAVRSIAQAQPSVVVVHEESRRPRRRRVFRGPFEALGFLLAVFALIGMFVWIERPEVIRPFFEGAWTEVGEAGVPSLATEAEAVVADGAGGAIDGEVYLWGAVRGDAVASIAMRMSSAKEAALARGPEIVTLGRTGRALVPPGAVTIRPVDGGPAVQRELRAGDALTVDCDEAGCAVAE